MSSIDNLVLRCLMPGFIGTSPPDWVRRRAAAGLGGVVLYGRNIEGSEQLRELNAKLHAERPELVVAIDEEGGDVTRLEARTGSSYPGNLALGVANDSGLTRDVAAALGSDLSAVGIDLDLAPVADVNSNPSNPVIGVRSFGSDAKTVARHTEAWVTGLQSTGVAACAKHFPGHGDTSVDSHLALPVVNEDPHRYALEPFRAAIRCGVKSIMSAHILVPGIDDVPATVSHRIMTSMLRHELGFQGLAVTDGLEMRGLSNGLGVPRGAVRALVAGCDALCIGGGLAGEDIIEEITRAVANAVKTGELSEQRLAEAASRVDELSIWRSGQPRMSETSREIGLFAARRAVRSDGRVQVGDTAFVLQLDASPSMAAGVVQWGVADALAERSVRVTRVADAASALDRAGRQSLIIVVRNLHRHPAHRDVVEMVLALREDAIVVEMGLPVCRPSAAKAYIATNGAARVCGAAAAELMRP